MAAGEAAASAFTAGQARLPGSPRARHTGSPFARWSWEKSKELFLREEALRRAVEERSRLAAET